MHYERVVEINAPPERVWAVMADVERWHEWTASIREAQLLDGAPLAEGTRVRIRQPRLPATVWRVSSFQPDRGFAWESSGPGTSTIANHRIEANGTGSSRVALSIRIEGILAGLVGVLMGGMIRRYVNMEAEGLKQRAEAGA